MRSFWNVIVPITTAGSLGSRVQMLCGNGLKKSFVLQKESPEQIRLGLLVEVMMSKANIITGSDRFSRFLFHRQYYKICHKNSWK